MRDAEGGLEGGREGGGYEEHVLKSSVSACHCVLTLRQPHSPPTPSPLVHPLPSPISPFLLVLPVLPPSPHFPSLYLLVCSSLSFFSSHFTSRSSLCFFYLFSFSFFFFAFSRVFSYILCHLISVISELDTGITFFSHSIRISGPIAGYLASVFYLLSYPAHCLKL